jgi:hypothetical protein
VDVYVCVLAGMPDFHLSRFFFQFTFAASAFSLGRSKKTLSKTFTVFLTHLLMTFRITVYSIGWDTTVNSFVQETIE